MAGGPWLRPRGIRCEEEAVVQIIRCRDRQTLGVVAEDADLRRYIEGQAVVGKNLVVLEHATLRTLDGRVQRGCCPHRQHGLA